MSDLFCKPGIDYSCQKKEPTLKEIKEVKSDLEQYQTIQITDLFIGCILNNLVPTINEFKNQTSEYLTKKVGKNFTKDEWKKYSKSYVEEYHPKFDIWFWKPLDNKKDLG